MRLIQIIASVAPGENDKTINRALKGENGNENNVALKDENFKDNK